MTSNFHLAQFTCNRKGTTIITPLCYSSTGTDSRV